MHALPAALTAAACTLLAASAGPDAAALRYVQWAGPESHHPPGFVLVRDQQAWLTLWAEHTVEDTKPAGAYNRHAAPEVNFDRCLVVAYFRGPATNEDGEVVRALEEAGGHLRVRFCGDTFQAATFDGSDSGAHTTPFGIWVLPATAEPIIIEEGRAGLKDEPLAWTQVQSFDAR